MPRILLLHVSIGTGHKRAAQALHAAFAAQNIEHVRVVDVLDYTSRIFRIGYAQAWIELTDHAPLIWGYFYNQTNDAPELAKISNNIRKLVESVGVNDLKKVLHEFSPDIIICTHFLPMELLMRLKRTAQIQQPIYCVITDYVAHTFWTCTDIDGYFVGDEKTKTQLIARHVPAERIHVSGIPINLDITDSKDAASIRTQRDLPPDKPVITLFGGGIADERVRAIVEGMLQSPIEGMLIVIAGRNPTLIDSLADLTSGTHMRLQLKGFVTYVDDLIVASDLVITKAGGLIISELLARGKPIVVIDPIPGHEEWNADYVVRSGAGIQLRMAQSVPATVNRLLNNPMLLHDMYTNARNIAHPHAAHDIVTEVLTNWE